MTKKKRIAAVVCMCAFLLLCACADMPRPGKTADAEVEQVASEIYTQKEIDQAIRVAERYFRKHFYGCSLLRIRYAGDGKAQEMEKWAKQFGADQAILLDSDFWVPENGGDGSLNYNYTYTNWNWILTRNGKGSWVHRDHGY